MSQVSDLDLGDFVDGRLDEPRRSEIARAIAADPDFAAKLEAYSQQARGLHELYDDVLREPVPPRLAAILRDGGAGQAPQRPAFANWRHAAAFAGILAVGAVGGWLAHGYFAARSALLDAVVKRAVLAHEMHEVATSGTEDALGADSDAFAISAEANPFEVPLRAPSTVGPSNFVPVEFQSAVGAAGPTVQLAYRDDKGEEVTLFVHPHSASKRLPYETMSVEGFDILYWIDGPLVYVLVGEGGGEQLLKLADSFYGAQGIRPAAMKPPAQ